MQHGYNVEGNVVRTLLWEVTVEAHACRARGACVVQVARRVCAGEIPRLPHLDLSFATLNGQELGVEREADGKHRPRVDEADRRQLNPRFGNRQLQTTIVHAREMSGGRGERGRDSYRKVHAVLD